MCDSSFFAGDGFSSAFSAQQPFKSKRGGGLSSSRGTSVPAPDQKKERSVPLICYRQRRCTTNDSTFLP